MSITQILCDKVSIRMIHPSRSYSAVTLCFLTSGVLLTLTSLTFLLGTTIQKICTDLEPPDYVMFREVLDNPSLWGGHTLIGSIAGESDVSLNLSVSDFLK